MSIVLMLCIYMAQSQVILTAAQAQAKKENKFILLNFSGSDWCIPCIQMQKDYFENGPFIKMADSQLVIIRADFPRKKKNLPSPELVAQNEMLAEKFNSGGSFPLTLLMDADGRVIKKWDGRPDENPAVFTTLISNIIQQYKQH